MTLHHAHPSKQRYSPGGGEGGRFSWNKPSTSANRNTQVVFHLSILLGSTISNLHLHLEGTTPFAFSIWITFYLANQPTNQQNPGCQQRSKSQPYLHLVGKRVDFAPGDRMTYEIGIPNDGIRWERLFFLEREQKQQKRLYFKVSMCNVCKFDM